MTVSVGAIRKGAFAERACSAKLVWEAHEIPVVSDAGEVAIDVLGADLGFGKPVVAFQIDKSGGGSKRVYQIFLSINHRVFFTRLPGVIPIPPPTMISTIESKSGPMMPPAWMASRGCLVRTLTSCRPSYCASRKIISSMSVPNSDRTMTRRYQRFACK